MRRFSLIAASFIFAAVFAVSDSAGAVVPDSAGAMISDSACAAGATVSDSVDAAVSGSAGATASDSAGATASDSIGAAASDPVLDHLVKLGVTAIELMPVPAWRGITISVGFPLLVMIAIPSFRLLYGQYDPSKLYEDYDPQTQPFADVYQLRQSEAQKLNGYAWVDNSQYFRLTPWYNDPVTDPPGDRVLHGRTGEIHTNSR
mgnify:CR=1 FL=1